LMPALNRNYENLADPEAREKTKQALDTLTRVGAVVDGKAPEISKDGDMETVAAHLKSIVGSKADKFETIVNYVGAIGGQLVDEKVVEPMVWAQNTVPFLTVISGDEAKNVAEELRKKASPLAAAGRDVEPDEEEGEDLCNCTFNLAYGAKILLNQTHLRLKRGQRYGLLGPNGSGKTTLMRAINNEQVEGFPKQSEVKTVYVEHDLDSDDTEKTVIGWTMQKLAAVGVQTPEDEVRKTLIEFGFLPEQLDGPIGGLSGGWKMKLALARAVFEKPDILLLDEPTNHLDVK
ncbi:ARM repeat-containing protein, partial [Aureobasidium melanogenum]